MKIILLLNIAGFSKNRDANAAESSNGLEENKYKIIIKIYSKIISLKIPHVSRTF